MDFRYYLELEARLQRKLVRAWQPQAAALMDNINDLIASGKFDEARQAAMSIGFTDLGNECRNHIKYTLQACIYYGGAMASGLNPQRTFVSVSNHDGLLEQVTTNFLQTLAYNVTQATQESALQSIAQAEAKPVTKKENSRYVRDFVSFQKAGNERMMLISSLHSSRLSTWGFTAEAEVLGYQEYQLTAVLDGRTSDFCRAIHGKRFKVSDAVVMVNKVLKVQNPDDVKMVQPWPKQDKASIEMFRDATPEQLTAMGLHIPPFHPHCRTLCTRVDKAPKIQAPYVEGAKRIIPESQATLQDFQDVNVEASKEQVDHWNAYMGVSPVDVVAKVTGQPAMQVLESSKKVLSFSSNGDIKFKVNTPSVSNPTSKFSMALTYDPYMSLLKVMTAVFVSSTPTGAADHLKTVLGGVADVGMSIGAEAMLMSVEGQSVRYYTDMGFRTSAAAWYDLKNDIIDRIYSGDLSLAALSDDERQVVMDVLSSRTEEGLQALLNLPFQIDGMDIGDYLIGKDSLTMMLPFGDTYAVEKFRGSMA